MLTYMVLEEDALNMLLSRVAVCRLVLFMH